MSMLNVTHENDRRRQWPPSVFWSCAGLVVGLAASVGLATLQAQRNIEQAKVAFTAIADETADQVFLQMRMYEHGLHAARGVVLTAGENNITRKTFHDYLASRDLAQEFPGARGFGFIRRVAPADKSAFLLRVRRTDWPDFTVRQFAPHEGESYIVQFIEPVAANQQAVGLDAASETIRRTALETAMRTGLATLSRPITIPQASGAVNRSFLVLLPIYPYDAPIATEAQRLQACIGWTYAPLVIDEVLHRVVSDRKDFSITLADVTDDPKGDIFFRSSNSETATTPYTVTQVRPLFGRQWQFHFTATPAYLAGLHQLQPSQVLATGAVASALLTSLLMALLALLGRRRQFAAERGRLATIIENTSDAAVGESMDGRIIFWNPAAERLFGFTRESALGREFKRLLVPDELWHEHQAMLDNMTRGKALAPFDTVVMHRDGFALDVSVTPVLIRESDDTISGVARLMRDIGARKKAEAQLHAFNMQLEAQVISRTAELEAARRTLQTVLDGVPSLISHWDKNLRNIVANRAYRDWFGIDPTQLQGMHIREFLGDELTERFRPYMEAALKGEPQQFERETPNRDGSGTRHSLATYIPDMVNGEVRGFYAIVHDITDITESRLALTRERERLQHILSGTNVGTWEWDVLTGGVTIDARWANILGYQLDELQPFTIQTRIDLAHPDELAESRERLRKHFAGELEFYDFECRLRHKQGHWVWTLDRGRVSERSADGRALRMHGTLLDLSEVKEAQRRVAESEAFLDRVGNVAGVGGWQYDLRTRKLTWSNQTRRIAEVAEDYEPDLDDMLRMCQQDGRVRIEAALHAAFETGQAFDLEAAFRTAAGRDIWVRVVGEAVHDATAPSSPLVRLVGALQDVTQRHVLESTLRRQNAMQKVILDNLPCALSVFDADLNLVTHNDEYLRLLDLETLFMQGVPNFEDIIRFIVLRGEYGECDVESTVAQIVGSVCPPAPHQFERIRPNGVPIEVRGAPLPGGGFVFTHTDVTDRKRLETDLRDAVQRAEQANRAKSEFVANMSHEIRTPLNAVLGMTHLLANTSLLPDQKNYVEMIRVSGQSLLYILNDILDFSKIEAGKLEIATAPFELARILRSLASIMSMSVGEKDIELIIGVDPKVPSALVGDALRLEQVLINLTSNAIKFTEHGEVVVSLSTEAATSQSESPRLDITVRDTGIGISLEQQKRLFSPFMQADPSVTRRFGGTGLGLAISRQLVALMGGTIDLRSKLGIGSEFHISLPVRVADSEAETTSPFNVFGALRLLVVDDNATSRAYLSKTIAAWGWEVDSAGSGAQAVELVRQRRSQSKLYDVVLLDWTMPDMDGTATMQEIRLLLSDASMPIVMMVSAFGLGKMNRIEAASKADAFLTKPVTSSNLFDALHEVLARRDPNRTQPALPDDSPLRFDFKIRVLLVEDNPFNQIVAKGILEEAGAAVDIVDNGQKAVDLLRIDAGTYQIVLMDVQMPVMDGFRATHLIRDELGLNIPILAMSAGVLESERQQCIASGMDDFIAKPIVVEQMLAIIARHLPPSVSPVTSPATPAIATEPYNADDIFDVTQLVAAAKGNETYRLSLIDQIRRTTDGAAGQLADARQAVSDGRLEEAARIFHTMRGSIGSLGAKRFVATTLDIEAVLKQGNASDAALLLERVEQELDATVSAARAWLAAESLPAKAMAAEEAPLDVQQLGRLKQLLREQDMEACDVFAAMEWTLRRYFDAERLAGLAEAIDNLDFATAEARLGGISASVSRGTHSSVMQMTQEEE